MSTAIDLSGPIIDGRLPVTNAGRLPVVPGSKPPPIIPWSKPPPIIPSPREDRISPAAEFIRTAGRDVVKGDVTEGVIDILDRYAAAPLRNFVYETITGTPASTRPSGGAIRELNSQRSLLPGQSNVLIQPPVQKQTKVPPAKPPTKVPPAKPPTKVPPAKPPTKVPPAKPPTQPDVLTELARSFAQPQASPVDMVDELFRGTDSWGSGRHLDARNKAMTNVNAAQGTRVDLLGKLLSAQKATEANQATNRNAAARDLLGEDPTQTAMADYLSFRADPANAALFQTNPEIADNYLRTLLQARQQRQDVLDVVRNQFAGAQPQASIIEQLTGGPQGQADIQWASGGDQSAEEALRVLQPLLERRAEGGEVGSGVPLDDTPVPDMDTGDYVIPIEAVRFYGRKFFQDLSTRAENADLQ